MPTHYLMNVQAELHPDNAGPVSCSQNILRHNYQYLHPDRWSIVQQRQQREQKNV